MSITAQALISNMPNGKVIPPAGVSVQAVKSRPIQTIEEALSLLKIVNVENEVLGLSALPQDKKVLTRLARAIVAETKSSETIKLSNGRIMIPKETFKNLLDKSADPPELDENAATIKIVGNGQEQDAKKAKAQNQQPKAEVLPLFAPPPPVFKKKNRAKNGVAGAPSSAAVSDEKEADESPMLSCAEAYYILVDIVPPGGGKYLLQVQNSYEDSKEREGELEKGIEAFWKDYGHNISVNAKFCSFIIRPRFIVDSRVNAEVSKKLVMVYISQSPAEKLATGRIKHFGDGALISPAGGKITINVIDASAVRLIRDLNVHAAGTQPIFCPPQRISSLSSPPR